MIVRFEQTENVFKVAVESRLYVFKKFVFFAVAEKVFADSRYRLNIGTASAVVEYKNVVAFRARADRDSISAAAAGLALYH